MSKIIIVKKGGSVTVSMPCPWFIEAPSDTRK